jgi:ElaB/YqjD/DUF883 family membrane-anchored ribosome-binding protein
MANESEPQVIRHQMEAQRAALDQKLESLENRIVATVENAREAVADTVSSVKEGFRDSVDSVKDTVETSVHAVQDTFDLPAQVDRHPWTAFGGAVAVGFVAGCILNRTGSGSAANPAAANPAVGFTSAPVSAPSVPARAAPSWTHSDEKHIPSAPPSPGGTWADHLARMFAPEFEKLKSLAVGTLMGMVREMVSEPLPDQMRPQAKEILDNITTKLGGAVMSREAVEPLLPQHRVDQHNGHHNGRHAEATQSDVLDDERRGFGS